MKQTKLKEWKSRGFLAEYYTGHNQPFESYDEKAASLTDRIAWALCQIIDDDAPLRWTRYRGVAICIAKNPELMVDLHILSKEE